MAVLNLRDVPEEIMRSLKVDAAASGKTLRELCLERLVPDGGKSWLPVTIKGEPIKTASAKKNPNTHPHGSPFAPRPISTNPSDWSGAKAVPISADTKDWKGSKAVPLARPKNSVTYGEVERLPPTGPQCMYCGGLNGVHKDDCQWERNRH